MARNVNVWITNWRQTGQQVSVPQYAVDIRAEWIGNDGQPRERTETVRFPNILGDVPASWIKEELTNLMFRALRVKAGIDVTEQGASTFAVSPALTLGQRAGQWIVRNSSVLQWVQKRRES